MSEFQPLLLPVPRHEAKVPAGQVRLSLPRQNFAIDPDIADEHFQTCRK